MTHKLYKVLGLDINDRPTEQDIKKAYKKKAIENHPDKNKDDANAEEKFKEVSNAYETLSDEKKKRIYDQVGDEGYKNNGEEPGYQSHPDIFEQFFRSRQPFGQNFGFPFGFNEEDVDDTRTRDAHKNFSVSLEDVFKGVQKNINLNITMYCKDCMTMCENCNGKGKIQQMKRMGIMTQVFTGACHVCSGAGFKIDGDKSCNACQGNGKYQKDVGALLSLPKGIGNDYLTVFEKMGEQSKDPSKKPGNLILHINVQEHKHFKRNGNDLIYRCELSYVESVVGKEIKVPYFEEFSLHTSIFGVVYPGKQYMVQNKGMPILNADKVGNMFIEFDIKYPKIKNKERAGELEALLREVLDVPAV